MLRGLLPRLFGMFREGGIYTGTFTFETDDDSWSVNTGTKTMTGFTVADGGTGLVTVTFPACTSVRVLYARIANATPGTFGSVRQVELPIMTDTIAKSGTFTLALYLEDGTTGVPALSDPADGAVLELGIYCNK